MAVALEFLNLVIPIEKIEQYYRGGWERYLEHHEHLIGRRIWFDDHLLRDGAMNPKDMSVLIDEWVDTGLRTIEETNGKPRWVDCCVIASIFDAPTLPCKWVQLSPSGWSASLKGHPPGEVVGRAEIAA
jgi:hypothetical protein